MHLYKRGKLPRDKRAACMTSRLGLLVAGSVAEGLSARLDPTVAIEDVRLGKFVKIVGQKYEYFCLVTDVQLDSANPDVPLPFIRERRVIDFNGALAEINAHKAALQVAGVH